MNCIETLNLTHSFGWVSNEALRQQDLQELCRIMFEALEKELRNTTHFDLINKLYQGTYIFNLKYVFVSMNIKITILFQVKC